MLLAENSIKDYASQLASATPAPGGGSAAALAGALGAALTHMVGAYTEGRAKYAEYEAFTSALLERTRAAQLKLLRLVDEDAAAFNSMNAAYKLPKNSEAEKTTRDGAVQAALAACTAVPYTIMELCADTLRSTEEAVGKTNQSVVSDLGVAALCLKTAVQSAWLNVLVNAGSLKDARLASEYRKNGRALFDEAVAAADRIYGAIRQAFEE